MSYGGGDTNTRSVTSNTEASDATSVILNRALSH